ncbi:pyruvate dehydrogenase complex E1 component subunit beta [Rubrivirga sp. S365]|uniref:Pyruvate dehydrogenase complex E1 component subunit beta n=1 Tax=Rubrivirga litoralis TaxID=3075598 RepID=A0ABU3BSA6_9BACT|nr:MULTISPECIES: pyruvate dehydrogenase complex E1 component subunit beta [unclassified Rubrivirga]MDT0632167.1 pyruvate dehydrogenase complex E1 component subunit beta [Rubrivirga sp. F394]MDT7857061.1 pyruvate dehydrogenase complex E1 component subunit beta [Rubrivirga sp. S365]
MPSSRRSPTSRPCTRTSTPRRTTPSSSSGPPRPEPTRNTKHAAATRRQRVACCVSKLPAMAELQFREALRDAMTEEMERDESVFLMGEEVAEYDGAYKVSQGMLDQFGPKRVVDTPISESGFTGLGIGAAMLGLRPIIEFMTWNFTFVAFDQIVSNAAKVRYMSGGQAKVPIVMRGGNGAAGQLGATHSNSVEAFYTNVPGLKVVAPSNPDDAKGLLKAAIRDDDPVLFLESELMFGLKGEVSDEKDYLLPIGKARIAREGDDLTIVAHSKSYWLAMEAAEELAKQGYEATVIDPRTLRPFDTDAVVESVKKTNRLVIVDESQPFGGVASEVAFRIQQQCFDHLDAPIERVTAKDVPAPYAKNLIEAWMPSVDETIQAAKRALYV